MNIDVVLPPSERCEQWEFQMWVDWINETLERQGLTEKIEKMLGGKEKKAVPKEAKVEEKKEE